PPSLFNAGFQLSFMAVLSIAYGFLRLPDLVSNSSRNQENAILKNPVKSFSLRHRWVYNYIVSSLFATLGTFPIIAYYFNLISIIGLIVNIIAIPLSSLIVPLTLIFSMLSIISKQIASLLIEIPVFLTFLLMEIARRFTDIPYYSMRVQTPYPITVIMIYLLLLGVLNFTRHKLIKIGTMTICLFLIISVGFRILISNSALRTPNSLKVIFIDVGQGESSLIRFPNGKTMLIDGGGLLGDFDIGGNVVAPYLWDIGITKIDYVIGSHPDSDHVGGLLFILDEMTVKNYYDNGQESKDLSLFNLRKIVRDKNIPYKVLQTGDTIKVDEGIQVDILHPSNQFGVKNLEFRGKHQNSNLDTQYSRGHDNNLSIVIKI
ncbi:MAG: ComEC/Rec2 family competence protein, partial [Nitrospinota bacterium]